MSISIGLVYNERTENGGFKNKSLKCDDCGCKTTVMLDFDRKFVVCKSCISKYVQKLDVANLNC